MLYHSEVRSTGFGGITRLGFSRTSRICGHQHAHSHPGPLQVPRLPQPSTAKARGLSHGKGPPGHPLPPTGSPSAQQHMLRGLPPLARCVVQAPCREWCWPGLSQCWAPQLQAHGSPHRTEQDRHSHQEPGSTWVSLSSRPGADSSTRAGCSPPTPISAMPRRMWRRGCPPKGFCYRHLTSTSVRKWMASGSVTRRFLFSTSFLSFVHL